MDKELFNYLCGLLTEQRLQRFKNILAHRTRFITVALEDVYQMHNASAVIRSCDVFGVQDAHLIQQKYGERVDKNIAMGAQKWVDIYRYHSADACLSTLKNKGYRILATSPTATSVTLNNLTLDRPTAFFFGTEKNGLSPNILQQADATLKIPMYGFTESLNVSVSVAIVLQYARQLLQKSADRRGLSEEEIQEKMMDWVRKSVKDADAVVERFYLERKGE